MNLDKGQYKKIYTQHAEKSKLFRNCIFAFLIGGTICLIAEIFRNVYLNMGMSKELVATALPITMVFIGVLLTGLKLYHKIAKVAGAGTLVPITGIANAISSAAIEFRSEGIMFGTCVKMFSIAGPVIVCGTSASIVYGLILLLMR